MKVYPAAALANAPETFKSVDAGKFTSKFGEKVTTTTGKVKLDSADKSDTVSFAKNAVSKELCENRAGACARSPENLATQKFRRTRAAEFLV